MESKIFKINELPDLYDKLVENSIENDIEKNIEKIYINYEYLITDTFKIIRISLEENIVKPLIIYDLIFGVELFLKLYLIRFSTLELEDVENKGHNIWELIKSVNNIDKRINFQRLEYLLQCFRDKRNNKLEIQKYYNYKYNHEKGSKNLIFDYQINGKEKNRIEEVIKCINSYIQIL